MRHAISPATRNPDATTTRPPVGYDLPGPSILLGNPQDNPLIAHLATAVLRLPSALPYPGHRRLPGRGHGMLAWNFASLGHDLESVACIAYDADGMSEAVGTLFQLAIGVDPLTPLVLPSSNNVTPATTLVEPPAATTLWQTYLPDRVTALTVGNGDLLAASANAIAGTIAVAAGKAALTPVNRSNVPAPDKTVRRRRSIAKEQTLRRSESETGAGRQWPHRHGLLGWPPADLRCHRHRENPAATAAGHHRAGLERDTLVVGLADGCPSA